MIEATTRGAGNTQRKTPVMESLFNKVADLQAFRLQHRCFPVNIAKILKTPILKIICQRLLIE